MLRHWEVAMLKVIPAIVVSTLPKLMRSSVAARLWGHAQERWQGPDRSSAWLSRWCCQRRGRRPGVCLRGVRIQPAAEAQR